MLGFVNRLYLMNCGLTFLTFFTIKLKKIFNLINPNTLVFIKKNNFTELSNEMNKNSLERCYGGDWDGPEKNVYWPPEPLIDEEILTLDEIVDYNISVFNCIKYSIDHRIFTSENILRNSHKGFSLLMETTTKIDNTNTYTQNIVMQVQYFPFFNYKTKKLFRNITS